MRKYILASGLTQLLVFPSSIFAHEETEILLGSHFFEFLFICVLVLFITLLMSGIIEKIITNKKHQLYINMMLGCIGTGVIFYFVYHYFVH